MSISNGLPEVHDEKPEIPVEINRVGVRGYRAVFRIKGFNNRFEHEAILDLYVDLPGDRRGVHVSRFIDAVENVVEKTYDSIYDLLDSIGEELLKLHNYSKHVEVYVETTYYLHGSSDALIRLGLLLDRSGGRRYVLNVKLYGLTVCPCVQKIYSYLENTPLDKTPSHMQRTLLDITLLSSRRINLDRVINVGLKGFSAPLRKRVKRYEEYRLVKEALNKPRFVEDVVRIVSHSLAKELGREGFEKIVVKAYSEESIHPYNITAEIETRPS